MPLCTKMLVQHHRCHALPPSSPRAGWLTHTPLCTTEGPFSVGTSVHTGAPAALSCLLHQPTTPTRMRDMDSPLQHWLAAGGSGEGQPELLHGLKHCWRSRTLAAHNGRVSGQANPGGGGGKVWHLWCHADSFV